jgi:hypothetical protein
VVFDDGSGDAYTVGYPDVIAPSTGFNASLEYSAGNLAAVEGNGVIYLAFPFETITGAASRNEIVQAVARDLIPSYDGTDGPGFPTGSGDGSNDDGGCAAIPAHTNFYMLILLATLLLQLRGRRSCVR